MRIDLGTKLHKITRIRPRMRRYFCRRSKDSRRAMLTRRKNGGLRDENREDSPHSSLPVATPRRTAPLRRRKGEGEGAVALAHAHNAHTTVFRFSSSPFTFAVIRLKITPLRVKVFAAVCVSTKGEEKKAKAFTPNQLWNSKLWHMGEGVKAKIQNLLTRAHARRRQLSVVFHSLEAGRAGASKTASEELDCGLRRAHCNDGRRSPLPPRAPCTDTHRGRAQQGLRHGLDFGLCDENDAVQKK